MELVFPAPLSASSQPPYHFPPAHDPFHVETPSDRQVQSVMQHLPPNSVKRAINSAASPVAPLSQPQTLAPSHLADTPISSTPTSPKRQPHFFLGSSPSKEDSLLRSRHDSSPSATVLSEPRSRASSKARRHGRPGTSEDFQVMRVFTPSSPRPHRRAFSLDESALPSFRPRNPAEDVTSPYLSCYSSASPLVEDTSDPMPIPTTRFTTESIVKGTTASHKGRKSLEHSILVGRRKTWHTLAEVMSTEKGYLSDLRALVLVYLDQLPNFFQLSADDYNAVVRNSQDLLELHEDLAEEFVQVDADLQAAGYPDFHNPESNALGRGLDRATRILVANSSRFESYEAYCSGHSEALNVIRNLQARPSDWDAYEQRCATLVSGAMVFQPAIRRRHSTDSMRLFGSHPETAVNRSTMSRLRLIDFLIKPVQRICKYPLLLSQLQETMATANLPSTADVDLVSLLGFALGTMKHVVGQVDEARKHRETMIRSSQILSRVEPHPVLSPSLLETLGPSLLIGSLEVIYHHPVFAPLKAPMRARYYGVFLYPGYLVMAKIKRAKTYDLRQWFPLQGGELVDTLESQSFLPYTFRFASGLHHFDFIARCAEEKEIWVQAFKQALKGSTTVAPAIANQTSLQPGVNRIAQPSEQVGLASFLADGLSTADKELGLLNDKSLKGPGLSPARNSISLPNASPKRRTSLFSSDPLSSTLRRPTASHRLLVDKALADVFSEACMRARSQAAPLSDQITQVESTVARRPGSWGRATSTMLNRTSSVSSMFYRRSGADFRAAGSSSRSSGEDITEITRPASSGNVPSNNTGRSMIVFPHHSLSMTRRRAAPVITSTSFSVNGQGVLEADEDGNEEMLSPVSTVFPLTPEAAAFQENLASAHSTSSETHEPHTTSNRPPSRSASTRSSGIAKHTRRKSQSLAQNVRELFQRPRSFVSAADPPSEPPEKVRVLEDQPTGLNPGGYPSAPLLLVPQPSVFQRGLTLIRKRVTSTITVSDGMANGRPRLAPLYSSQPKGAFSKAELSPSDDDDGDSVISMRGVLASPPRPKSFDIAQVNNPTKYANFPSQQIPIRPHLQRASTSLATTVLS
ncbi:hypothetical protein M407DRAFT_20645 [Tulasnella calospora MUT 4182]|uniref:DH domain-containing protein n=1 Tax=Tulasnella calospora MUT 4182 TaxID=1051891 RepID=A0A0C3M8X6_9AGAM|nr:hypothetical protein M407DRAFT_20645 [Tulasnella calospora MUT 4182]